MTTPKLPSTHAVIVVRYGEGQKHLYRDEDDPMQFCANEASAITEARKTVLDCDGRQVVVVVKIEYLFVPKVAFDEHRVDGEASR